MFHASFGAEYIVISQYEQVKLFIRFFDNSILVHILQHCSCLVEKQELLEL